MVKHTTVVGVSLHLQYLPDTNAGEKGWLMGVHPQYQQGRREMGVTGCEGYREARQTCSARPPNDFSPSESPHTLSTHVGNPSYALRRWQCTHPRQRHEKDNPRSRHNVVMPDWRPTAPCRDSHHIYRTVLKYVGYHPHVMSFPKPKSHDPASDTAAASSRKMAGLRRQNLLLD